MDGKYSLYILSIMAAFLGGCAGTHPVKMPPPRPLAAQYLPKDDSSGTVVQQSHWVDETEVSTLQDALALALLYNPELQSFAEEVRVAEAHMLQASLWSNPLLGVTIDEYNRDGAGFDSSEVSVVVAQRFEPSNQRRRRVRVAELQGEMAGWEYERRRMEVLTSTTLSFINVLAAEQRLEAAETLQEFSARSSSAVEERVKAGEEVPYQATKARAEHQLTQLETQKANDALDTARRRLASHWGKPHDRFGVLEGNLHTVPERIPALEALQSHLEASPDLEQIDAELWMRREAHALELAERIPDIEASVGYKRFETDETDALVFGVEVPLPLFNRNQGRIAASTHRLAQSEARQVATRTELFVTLADHHAKLVNAHQRLQLLRNEMVPAMQEAFSASYEGYRAGKLDLFEMLDAQRSLKSGEAALIEALVDYHTAKAMIEGSIGIGLDELVSHNMRNNE